MTNIQIKPLVEDRFIRLPEVQKLLPFGKSTIWKKISEGTFPKPHKISPRVTAWLLSDIMAYVDSFKAEGSQWEQ